MENEKKSLSLEGLDKCDARRRMRKGLAELSESYRKQAALALLEILKPLLKDAKCVFLFASFKHEIDTAEVDEFLRTQKVERCFPHIGERKMRALLVPADAKSSSLSKGAYGIPSPLPSWPECDPKRIDVILLPGLAFGDGGVRLGQGGGFYDRALPRFKNARRIGIGFDEQWVKGVPTDVHDQRVHDFVSNKRHVEGLN